MVCLVPWIFELKFFYPSCDMSLRLLEQSHLFLESVTKNGATKLIHYVVKQTPFCVKFGCASATPAFNFKTCRLECELLYDLPQHKEVEAIAGKPLEYVCHPSPDGLSCTVDFRVKVLTTQHQNNFFLIRATLVGADQRDEIYTHPIKSVSKPEQIRRRVSLQQQTTEEDVKPPVVGVAQSSSKKRARSEELLTTLEEMKEMQKHQSELLALLLSRSVQEPIRNPFSAPTFEEALTGLVRVYESQAPCDRPAKLRKVLCSLPAQDISFLNDIGKILTETRPELQRDAPPPTRSVSSSYSLPQTLSYPQQYPIFEFGSVGVDISGCDADEIAGLNNALYGWLQGSD